MTRHEFMQQFCIAYARSGALGGIQTALKEARYAWDDIVGNPLERDQLPLDGRHPISGQKIPPGEREGETFKFATSSGDRTFLNWIADRLVFHYHENENVDFVLTLRRFALGINDLVRDANTRELPRPIAFTEREGGMWFGWGEKPAPVVHAIKFANGDIIDTVNGWRPRHED